MAIKVAPPPKKNWSKVYGRVALHYSTLICKSGLDVRGRSSVKKRVKEVGEAGVEEVVRFYASWLDEDKWKKENFGFRGANWFFAFKFDEVNQIMQSRKDNEPKYEMVEATDEQRFVDPFQV
jgi:hypothetical protein